ncbi:lamin tail domain-containing protein [Patescibacteria group bacterium]
MFYKKILTLIILVVIIWPPFLVSGNNRPPIIINELMWMGSSLSSYDEWLELRNISTQSIDISGWYLTRRSSGEEKLMLTIPESSLIEAGEYFLISNYDSIPNKSSLNIAPDLVDSAVSLANNQLSIKLYNADHELIDVADDGSGKPLAGEYVSGSVWATMERNSLVGNGQLKESWHTASQSIGFNTNNELGTPGNINSNSAPVIELGDNIETTIGEIVSFDAADSYDPDGDQLVFNWDFGDNNHAKGPTPTHIYNKTGEYTVALVISDGYLEASGSINVTVEESRIKPPGDDNQTWWEPEVNDSVNDKLVIEANIFLNEILPNPTGLDKQGEFIELYNGEVKAVNISSWQITVGKKEYTFPSIIIPAEDYIALGYQTTKLTLTNAGCEVTLLNPNGKVIDSITYSAGKENHSFARKDKDWFWTAELTPGEENVINNADNILSDELDVNFTQEVGPDGSIYQKVSLIDVQNMESREKVAVTGIVSVLPGTFGSQFFYIFDGQHGLRIYSSKKAFPELEIGDQISVLGAVGESQGEKKINISNKEDITVLAKNLSLEPIEIEDELSESMTGSLITIIGQVKTTDRSSFTVTKDDAEYQVAIKRNTKIGKPDIEENNEVQITGIVSLKDGDSVIWPRSSDDIINQSQILGAVTAGDDIEIETNFKSKNVQTILAVLLIVTSMAGAGLGWWRKKRKIKSLAQ